MKRYLATGLLVWVPLGVTVLVIKFLVDVMDQTLLLLPAPYRPETLLGFRIPGLGILLTVLVVFVTGVVTANLFGRRLLGLWENILNRIPLVRSIYSGVKQVMETLVAGGGKSFRQVVMVEYPRRDAWTLAFVTGDAWSAIDHHVGPGAVQLFVPTTPNPTSGFFLIVPRKDIIELDISVDEGLKMIISAGVVMPGARAGRNGPDAPAGGAPLKKIPGTPQARSRG